MKYHGKLHFLYKLYFNKILSLSFILFSFVSSNIKNFVVTVWVSLCVLLYSVNNPYNFFQLTTLKIIDLAVYVWYVCVCACVRACVRACVCLYSSTCWFLLAARRLWHTWEVRINDLLLWILLGASAKFLHLYSPADSYWRENEW